MTSFKVRGGIYLYMLVRLDAIAQGKWYVTFFGHAHFERTRPKQEQRQQQQQQVEEGEAPLQEVDTSSSDSALHDEMNVNPFHNTQN